MVERHEIMSIDDSVEHILSHGRDDYPVDKLNRKTLGNIPPKLHNEIAAFAEERKILIYEVLAALWDFHKEYEATNEKELTAQRALPVARRSR